LGPALEPELLPPVLALLGLAGTLPVEVVSHMGKRRDDLFRIKRPCAEPIFHYVMPDLQHKEPAYERLVKASAAEQVEVIQVPQLAPPPPGSELFR